MKNFILFAAIAWTIGCGAKKQEQPAKVESPHAGATVQQQAQSRQIRGTVVETLEAKGFTYARLQTDGGDEWIVLPTTTLTAGQKLEVTGQMVTEKFVSKSLGRTFDKVTFVEVEGGAPHGEMPAEEANVPVQSAPEAKAAEAKPAAAKAAGAAKSVSEVLAARASLGDQTVVVRGKVAKSLNGIMGKNWVHLREGSDDLTFTTDEVVKVGDVVTLQGVVRLDKDFGAGYKYAMIIEDARVVR